MQYADVERLPFADGAFDNTVATLVFCSIENPRVGLAEVRRVTKPGGEVRFLEHVRADGGMAQRLQDWITPFWRRIGDGCHLNRRTVDLVREGGFAIDAVEDVSNRSGLLPTKVIRARVPFDPS